MSKPKLKIPPTGVFLLFAVVMWAVDRGSQDYVFNPLFRSLFMAVALAASAVFGVGGVMYFRKAGTTVHPLDLERSSTLVTSGVYRYSRNPMYLALLLALLAFGFLLSNLYALAIVVLFVPCMNRFQIRHEERALEKLFGEEFAEYRKAVRRWI